MGVSTGDPVPEVQLTAMGEDGPKPISSTEALGEGTVVLFGVPGAFTPGCSEHHLPGFVAREEDLRANGVDRIACVSVNDAFVMDAWGRDQGVGDGILMLADGNGDFTRAMGLEFDGSSFGLGERSRRYAAVIEDGEVRELLVEDGPRVDRSSAASVLAVL